MPEIVLGAVNTVKLVNEESDAFRDAVLIATGQGSSISGNILAANLTGMFRRAKRAMKYVDTHGTSGGLPVTYTGYSNGNPVVEGEEQIDPYDRDFLPLVPIRLDGVFTNADPSSSEYIENRRVCRHLKLDLNDMTSNLVEQQDPNGDPGDMLPNPDLDKLDDAFLVFGSDVYTEVEETFEYMFNFIERMNQVCPRDKDAYDAMIATFGGIVPDYPRPDYYNVFKLHAVFNNFDFKLNFNYTELTTHSGSLPEGTDFTKSIEVLPKTTYQVETNGGAFVLVNIQESFIKVTKDNKDGTVTDAVMHGPIVTRYVHATVGFATTQVFLDEAFKDLDPKLDDQYGKSGFYFPIQFSLYDDIKQIHQDKILHDSLMFSLHAADVIDLKWYETSLFKMILTFIAVVITFYSLGTAVKASVPLWTIAQGIAAAFVLGYILQLIAVEVGGEAAIILAIAVAIIAAESGYFNLDTFSLPFADELLLITNSVVDVITIEQEQILSDIQDDYEDLSEEHKKKMDVLRDQYRDIASEDDSTLSVFTVMEASKEMNVNESAGHYFKRTLQTDVNELSLTAVKEFVPNQLLLPELDIEPDVYITV